MKSGPAITAPNAGAERATLFWDLDARQAAMLGGVLLVTLIAYLPSLRNGWVVDDWEVFVNNRLIHDWSFVTNSFRYDSWWFRKPTSLPQSAFYRPLVNVWFAASTWLFGLHPVPWHLAKIGMHAVAVLLCFRIAQLLTSDVTVALLTAAIFGFMPAQVEAVVWVSSVAEPLSTVFELAALLFLVQRKPGLSGGLIGSLILYTGALLTHESSVLFPLIVAAYVFLIERGDDRRRVVAAVRAAAPFVCLAIIYMCVRAEVLGFGNIVGLPYFAPPSSVRGTEIPVPHYGPTQIMMTLPVVLLAYFKSEVIPGVAGPSHGVNWVTHAAPIVFFSSGVLIVLAVLSVAVVNRSSDRRLYLFCAVWSLLTIAPALNLNSILFLVHDRYLYAPSFGWSLAFALASTRVAKLNRTARSVVETSMALLLVGYIASTIRTEHFWHDDVTYFGRCVAIAPTDLDYRLRLQAALNKAGDREGALEQVRRDVEMYPNIAYLRLVLSQQYQMMGRQSEFMREFRKYIELSAANVRRLNDGDNSAASHSAADAAAGATPSPQ